MVASVPDRVFPVPSPSPAPGQPTGAPPGAPAPARPDADLVADTRTEGRAGPATRLSSLSSSLMQDLQRQALGRHGRRELLEVLAASVRHGQALSTRLQAGAERRVLSVFPRDKLLHCPPGLDALLATDLAAWHVTDVHAAAVDAPAQQQPPLRLGQALPAPWAPLSPLLWAVALAGSRMRLLPELAGRAAYRLAPGVAMAGVELAPPLQQAVQQLSYEASNLSTIARWPGIGPELACRLLNALYLHSALIVSRSHPAATNVGWRSYADHPEPADEDEPPATRPDSLHGDPEGPA